MIRDGHIFDVAKNAGVAVFLDAAQRIVADESADLFAGIAFLTFFDAFDVSIDQFAVYDTDALLGLTVGDHVTQRAVAAAFGIDEGQCADTACIVSDVKTDAEGLTFAAIDGLHFFGDQLIVP